MPEMDDITLLREYAETGSEAAFAVLVERHVNLVYSTARAAWATRFRQPLKEGDQ
jgi:hypothetical protein